MKRESRFDFGMLAVVLVLLSFPLAIWYLVEQLPSNEPTESREEIPEPTGELVPRGTLQRLERQLEAAQKQLDNARIEQSQSPPGTWDKPIAEMQREIVELRGRIDKLRRD